MSIVEDLVEILHAKQCITEISDIQGATRIKIKHKNSNALLDVFTTGTIREGGKDGSAKTIAIDVKNEYLENPEQALKTIQTTVEAIPTKRKNIDTYSSALCLLDLSKHSSFLSLIEKQGLGKIENHALVGEALIIQPINEKMHIQGLTEKTRTACSVLSEMGGRVERYVETATKEDIPILSSSWSKEIFDLAENELKTILGRELFDFLPAHDRRAITSSVALLKLNMPMPEIASIVMPIGRTFEGFVAKILIKLGLVTAEKLSDPSVNLAVGFDSPDAKTFKQKETTHSAMLDGLKQRLKEHRHIRLHSQSSRTLQGSIDDAQRALNRVVDDMQEYFKYFKSYFTQ